MNFPNVIIMCSCYQQFILCFAASDGQELAKIQKVKIIRNNKREGEWFVGQGSLIETHSTSPVIQSLEYVSQVLDLRISPPLSATDFGGRGLPKQCSDRTTELCSENLRILN